MDANPLDSEQLLARAAWTRRLAASLMHGQDGADDLAQEAWVAALQGAPAEEHRLRNWIAAVMARLAAKRRRGDARRLAREELAARLEATESAAAIVSRAQVHETLVRTVLSLDEPYRAALLLRYFDELPPAEIAQRQHLPLATVKTRLARGLEQLRARLDREHPRGRDEWLAALVPLLRRSPVPPAALAINAKLGLALLAALLIGLAAFLSQPRPPPAPLGPLSSAPLAAEQLVSDADRAAASAAARVESVSAEVSAASSESAPPAARDPDRELRGRVIDTAGRPIAGALVTAWPQAFYVSGSGDAIGLDEHAAASLTTDAEGRFDTELVRGHPYELRVEHAGFSPAFLLQCTPGVTTEVVLSRAIRLHGRVTFEDGVPASGALIELRPMLVFGVRRFNSSCRADERGEYDLVGATAGTQTITVWHPTALTLRANALAVGEGDDIERDFVLQRGGRAEGTVSDAQSGAPIAGALVTDDRFDVRAARTDARGHYELLGVTHDSPRWFALHVRASGYADGEGPTAELSGEVLHVDIALRRGRSVTGCVADVWGQPLAGVLVRAIGRTARGIDSHYLLTGADGSFALGDLAPEATHTLALSKIGFGRKLYDLPEASAAGAVIDIGRLTLARGSLVCGRVVTKDGHPLIGWVVQLTGANFDRARYSTVPRIDALDPYPRTMSNVDGAFALGDVAEGEYELTIGLKGFDTELRRMLQVSENERRDLGELVLDVGREIDGIVVDDSGVPVVGAGVEAALESAPDDRSTYAFTDAAGHFRLGGFVEAAYVLKVDHGLWPRVLPVATTYFHDVPAGASNLRLVLPPTAKISGRVLDADGHPQDHVNVARYVEGTDLEGWPADQLTTTDDGRFEFTVAVDSRSTLRFVAGYYWVTEEGTKPTRPVGTAELRNVAAGSTDLEVHLQLSH